MYADRYAQPARFSPGGLAAAVAINAAFVAALVFSAPEVVTRIIDTPLETYQVPDTPPPPPEPDHKVVQLRPATPTERIPVPIPLIERQPTIDLGETTTDPLPPVKPIGTDAGTVLAEPMLLPPMAMPFVEPGIDPRYAGDLQPAYPAAERRAGRDGRVSVRVLVGVDGRVKQAQQLSATSDAFWRATLDQAMRKWRFKPGTRGGIPVEAWRTLTLRFELTD